MVTVVFVHGTGVREPSYTHSLEAIRAGLGRIRPDVRVEPCDWGSALGSSLRAGGVSIPGYARYTAARDGRSAADPADGGNAGGWGADTDDGDTDAGYTDAGYTDAGYVDDDEDRVRWAMLYADPFAELGAYAIAERHAPAGRAAGFTPGAVPRGDQLLDLLSRLPDSGPVGTAWRAAVPDLPLAPAVASTLAAPELRRAAAVAPPEGDALPRLTARALTAWALTHSPGTPGAVPAAVRDALADAVTAELGGDVKGLGSALAATLGFSARLFERSVGSRLLVSRRAALSGRSAGFVGDILSYLARGRAVRDHVAHVIRALPPRGPVVVLGHSLGGVIAFDLLADPPPDLRVDLLVTVGSQAPLLYELDALPSRPYGTGLPGAFPRWLNVYDRRDLLSYLAAGTFGNDPRVTDAPVDNGQPVSAAHTSYWANDQFYRVLSETLPAR